MRARRSNLEVLMSLSVMLSLVLILEVATPGAQAAPKKSLVKNIINQIYRFQRAGEKEWYIARIPARRGCSEPCR